MNFGTTVYTGPLDVTTTLNRLHGNQSVVANESDDGGFFNFNPSELPNIPRNGANYYMEFMVWPAMNLAANTYDTMAQPYSGDTFPRARANPGGIERRSLFHRRSLQHQRLRESHHAAAVVHDQQLGGDQRNMEHGRRLVRFAHAAAGESVYLAVIESSAKTGRTITYDYSGPAVTLGDLRLSLTEPPARKGA